MRTIRIGMVCARYRLAGWAPSRNLSRIAVRSYLSPEAFPSDAKWDFGCPSSLAEKRVLMRSGRPTTRSDEDGGHSVNRNIGLCFEALFARIRPLLRSLRTPHMEHCCSATLLTVQQL